MNLAGKVVSIHSGSSYTDGKRRVDVKLTGLPSYSSTITLVEDDGQNYTLDQPMIGVLRGLSPAEIAATKGEMSNDG